MSLLLAIDSSTRTTSAAVGDAAGVRAELLLSGEASASTTLMPAVDQVLRSAGASRADLGGIVVAGGPGSFTGLRIAAATAKGMVQALGIPLFAYSGLMAAAAGAASGTGEVCALFDARRRDVFAAIYAFGAGDAVRTVLEPAVLTLGELLQRMDEAQMPQLFTGDGAVAHAAEIQARGGLLAAPHLAHPRASALLWLAAAAPEQGRISDVTAWEPDYLRASGAERIAADRAAAGA